MAEPKYWAQPSQPGFGARLGQALSGGLKGVQQGLAWQIAERQRKEKLEQEKLEQDFVNELKKAEEKRKAWEFGEKQEAARKKRRTDRYYEKITRPMEEGILRYDLEIKRKIAAGEISPDQAASDALKFATAELRKVQTELGKLEVEKGKIGLEELETPGRGGLGFEIPQGQRTVRTPPTITEEPVKTAETKIKELIAKMKNPDISPERRTQIADRIQEINDRLGKDKYSDAQILNWHNETIIGSEREKTPKGTYE